ncbi:hypothetical protein J2853_008830 [Streptosporangium lutulentum]|uniref:Uncharacterized protein n=1 Tax=Streptosporangium lutulentum TaxID=1461250 RepID=A0ABT9QUD6_9ACTN|nr:hypothetical protein [Streptosporangium lutulentum]
MSKTTSPAVRAPASPSPIDTTGRLSHSSAQNGAAGFTGCTISASTRWSRSWRASVRSRIGSPAASRINA